MAQRCQRRMFTNWSYRGNNGHSARASKAARMSLNRHWPATQTAVLEQLTMC
jgi:trimethylamine:corrinoid methyltransferase-like protein